MCVVFMLANSIFLLSGNGDDKSPAPETKMECDQKIVQSFPYCEACKKPLRGFKCPVCNKQKCEWCKKEQASIGELFNSQKNYTHSAEESKKNQDNATAKQKLITEHKTISYEITELKDFKCPCCGNALKNLEETDLVLNGKCKLCESNRIKQKEHCIKWVYGCPDGHKEILLPGDYGNACPELIDDGKGKKKECKKPLDKVEVNIETVIYKYVCPVCKGTSNKPGQCPICKKDYTKLKVCPTSGTFPHVNAKEWEKEQKAKRAEAKK